MDKEYKCEKCNIIFDEEEDFKSHVSGKCSITFNKKIDLNKYSLREDQKNSKINNVEIPNSSSQIPNRTAFKCHICSNEFSGPVPYYQHIASKRHHNELEKRLSETCQSPDADKPDPKEQSISSENSDFSLSEHFTCDICNKSFSGIVPYKQHMASNIHEKMLKRKKLEEAFIDSTSVGVQNANIAMLLNRKEDIAAEAVGNMANSDVYDSPVTHNQPKNQLMPSRKEIELIHEATNIESELKDNKLDGTSPVPKDGKILPDMLYIEQGSNLYVCKLCNKKCSGIVPFSQHVSSRLHQKQLQKKEIISRMSFVNNDTTSKLLLNETLQNIVQPDAATSCKSTMESLQTSVLQSPQKLTPADGIIWCAGGKYLFCTICTKPFTGVENAQDHLRSKKHWKTKQRNEMVQSFRNNQSIETLKEVNIKLPSCIPELNTQHAASQNLHSNMKGEMLQPFRNEPSSYILNETNTELPSGILQPSAHLGASCNLHSGSKDIEAKCDTVNVSKSSDVKSQTLNCTTECNDCEPHSTSPDIDMKSELSCEICNIQFQNVLEIPIHFESADHMEKKRKAVLNN